ncbi:Pleckstrin-like proteiny domain-containing family A member 5 [Harpegnathos saltator]|uniref:Pleckstrin-like proteiny domain-containing family A member 5 n=1 Tax=Harpegnathos saltator TaxID=610380 RepID=E2BI32_HARSA|nr:Pleckstrin-like proteiny domain-containing family A member 5 [Harpegnathos saltator]
MLWKKRWFVLSEYCLFYYKGPEEEKLLGSILLPSYRVTVCKPEDKVNKKFAFKAEHANMRTYHFAADSRDSMNQWVNALTLATLLQDPSPGAGEAAVVIEIAGQQDGERSARPSVSSISSILNQSADDSDSGFHGFQSRDDPSHASNNNSSPNSANTASFPNLSGSNSNGNSAGNNHTSDSQSSHPMMNGWIQQSPQYGQPGTSQPPPAPPAPSSQQQQQQQQYGHLLPSQQLQPGHSHQHQALLLQHLPAHQNPALPSAHQTSHPHKHQPMSRKFGQPIYANAPPKPRRLTDGSNEYSTPSPSPDYRKSPVSPDVVTVASKSPMSDYEAAAGGGRSAIYAARINQQPSQQSLRTDKSGLNYGYGQTQPTERRTPDTYGRNAKPRPAAGRPNGDYEEVYGTPQLYQRPAGPVGYTKSTAPAPIAIPLYAQHQQQQHLQQQIKPPVTPPTVSMVRQSSRAQPPPRPHSADFLEYEAARRPQQQPAQCEKPPNQPRRPQRPKSSLDIVNPSDTTNDGYFYSEERYAAQMRQSAVYLHQTPQHYQQQRNQSLSRATMQPKLPGIRDKPDESRVSTLPDSSCPALRRSQQRDHVHQQHTMPSQSLTQRHSEIMGADPKLRRSLREKSCEANGRETLATHVGGGGDDNTVPRRVLPREYDGWGRTTGHGGHGTHISQTCHAGYAGGGRRWSEQQQFCRSASARLPRTRHPAALDPDDDDYAERSSEQDSRDGERKIQQREESMKRLLEWKQRMLQSPLTRKPSGSANRGRAQNDLSSYYKQQALLDLAAHEAAVAEGRHSRRREDGHRSHIRSKSSDGRRTAAANVSRYNSYSSDDEAALSADKRSRKRPEEVAFEETAIRHKNSPRKPPGGILKTSSVYGFERQFVDGGDKTENSDGGGGLCGYRAADAWHVAKNVQWDAKEDNDEWGDPGIDESKVIKEFSYQYIRPKEAGDAKTDERHESMNLVQCRIRSFEMNLDGAASEKEVLSMQEPLKVSPLQAIEAHISKLECSNSKTSSVIRSFALGDPNAAENSSRYKSVEQGHSKQASSDSNKSVKDLLADFERKSQQANWQKCEKRQEAKHHADHCESEALRAPGGGGGPRRGHRRTCVEREKLIMDKDSDDRDEDQVAQCFTVDTLYADVGKQIDGSSRQGKPIASEDGLAERCLPRPADMDIVVSPGSPTRDRTSVTESLLTHGDQFSGDSDQPTSCISKQDDASVEDHYLPMTPRKAILDPNGDDRPNPKIMESLFANLEHEESSYVEMSQNGMSRSLLAPNGDGDKHDSGDYSTLDTSHYELVCVSDSKMEPVYMEVSQLSEKEDEESGGGGKMSKRRTSANDGATHPRADLPDILTALKSDSSDADDESSKDLDSIDAPRHPRFSLSDTFRPASYYLGASRNMIAELHDSSDSELVSPPPIPTSPPPLDDLDSLEMQESLEMKKVSPQVATGKDNVALSRDSPKSWSKPLGQVEAHRPPSRFSDATISSTFRGSRISLESTSGGSDTVELRNDEEARHRQLKRRPVSDDVCGALDSLDEYESLSSRFDGTSIDLDQYLEELQARDAFNVDLYAKDLSYNSIYGFNENMLVVDKLQKTTHCQDLTRKMKLMSSNLDRPFDYACKNKTGSASSLPSMRVSDLPPAHQHSQSFTGDAHYENITSFSPLRGSPAIRPDSEPPRDNNVVHRLQSAPQNGSGGALAISHSRDSSYSLASAAASIATSMACQRPASAQSFMYSPVSSVSSVNHVALAANQLQQSNVAAASPYAGEQPRFPNHSRSASHELYVRHTLMPTPSHHRSTSSQDCSHYPCSLAPPPPLPLPLPLPPTTTPVSTSSQSVVKQSVLQSYLPNAGEQRVLTSADQTGAPYYYSDLQASVNNVNTELAKPTIGHSSRLPQLNNQRDDASGLNKRNDIGRIVNPIARQMPRRIQVDDIEEARRIAAELRRTTCQLLADNKAALVDKRNFYEADTLRRVKSIDPLPPDVSLAEVNARNLYPHGLRDKSADPVTASTGHTAESIAYIAQASHRRSWSVEGLLDDVGLQNLMEQRNRANRSAAAAAAATATTAAATAAAFSAGSFDQLEAPRQSLALAAGDHAAVNDSVNFHVDDPWEQDTLWCENLRRVSLRNARSLDNLDSPPRAGGGSSSGDSKSRSRITRGATYVNDSVVLRRDHCADEPRGERARVKRRTNKDRDHLARERAATLVDDDDDDDDDDEDEHEDVDDDENDVVATYETLSMERIGAGGYVWDPQNEAYRKPSSRAADATNHFLEDGNLPPARSISDARMSAASFELDREKLRQWDLLSSACLLQEQQRTSMADSGRGLPLAEHPGDALDSRHAVVAPSSTTTTTTTTTATTTTMMKTTMTTTSTMTTTTTTTTTTTMTTMTTMTTDTVIDNERLDVVAKLDTADVRNVLPMRTMPTKKVQEPREPCKRAADESEFQKQNIENVFENALKNRASQEAPFLVFKMVLTRFLLRLLLVNN